MQAGRGWEFLGQPRSFEPAQHGRHHEVADAERADEPLGVVEVRGELAQPRAHSLVEDRESPCIPGLVALEQERHRSLDDRRFGEPSRDAFDEIPFERGIPNLRRCVAKLPAREPSGQAAKGPTGTLERRDEATRSNAGSTK